MGRIKGTLVKRTTKDLLASKHKTSLSSDFNKNKQVITQAIPGITKKVRSSISGYVARILKRREKK